MKKIYKFVVKSSMFICSYFPLYLLLIISNYDYIFRIKQKDKIDGLYLVICVVLIFFIIISIFVSIISLGSKPNVHTLTIEQVKRPTDTIISYVATYILPMTTIEFGRNFSNLMMNVMFFCFIGLLYTKLGLIYMNPIFVLFNFKPYDAKGKIIFSNLPYEKISQTGITWNATSIGGFVYVVRKKYNEKSLK